MPFHIGPSIHEPPLRILQRIAQRRADLIEDRQRFVGALEVGDEVELAGTLVAVRVVIQAAEERRECRARPPTRGPSPGTRTCDRRAGRNTRGARACVCSHHSGCLRTGQDDRVPADASRAARRARSAACSAASRRSSSAGSRTAPLSALHFDGVAEPAARALLRLPRAAAGTCSTPARRSCALRQPVSLRRRSTERADAVLHEELDGVERLVVAPGCRAARRSGLDVEIVEEAAAMRRAAARRRVPAASSRRRGVTNRNFVKARFAPTACPFPFPLGVPFAEPFRPITETAIGLQGVTVDALRRVRR